MMDVNRTKGIESKVEIQFNKKKVDPIILIVVKKGPQNNENRNNIKIKVKD